MEVLKTGGRNISATTSRNLQNGKQDSSLTPVRHLTKLEIQSLRDSKKEAYERMMSLK